MNTSLSPFPLKDTYPPFGNVNQQLVNIDASNWPGGFSSKATSLEFGLPAIRNNVHAAAASALQKGGSVRRKIKNISKKYRMSKQKRRTMKRNLKKKLSKLKGGYLIGKSKRRGTSRKSKSSRSKRTSYGGSYQGPYLQYESDVPVTPSFRGPGFAVGPSTNYSSALANPLPIQRMVGGSGSLCTTNCIDNYNHYKNSGFQTNGVNTGFN